MFYHTGVTSRKRKHDDDTSRKRKHDDDNNLGRKKKHSGQPISKKEWLNQKEVMSFFN